PDLRRVGDVRRRSRERERHRSGPDLRREWDRDRGKLDPRRHGGIEHVDGYFSVLGGQPRDVHGAGDGGGGGDDRGNQSHEPGGLNGAGDGGGGGYDCGEQCDESVGHGRHGRQRATVGDRQGRERKSGGGRGGDVHAGGGERDGDADDPREHGVGWDRRPDH